MKIKHTPVLLIILLFGLVYRGFFLFEPIRDDEGYTILNLAPQSIQTIRSDYSSPGNHVLYTILTHYTFYIFGLNHMELAVRFPALLSGLLVIYLTYVLAFLWTKELAVAHLSAFFVAASRYYVFYSVNGRGYTFESALVLSLVILMFSMPREEISALNMLSVLFLEALIPYVIPSGIIFVIPFHIWLLFSIRKRQPKTWLRPFLLISLGAFFVGFLLILPLLGTVKVRGVSGPELPVFGELLHRVCEGLLPIPVFYALLVVGLRWHRAGIHFRNFVLTVLVPYAVIAGLVNPIAPWVKFMTRHYLPLFPFALISVSCGIVVLWNWRPSPRWMQQAACAFLALFLIEMPAAAAYSVVRNPTLLYFPQRQLLKRCEDVIPDLSRTLHRGERIAGTSFYTDLGAAFYVTKTRGFHGFYSLYGLDQFHISHLYLIAESAQGVKETYQALGPTVWTPPLLIKREPPMEIYATERVIGQKR